MTGVTLKLPDFMRGSLPNEGAVTKDYILVGTDDVTLTIYSNSDNFYTASTKTFQTSTKSTRSLYKFTFPVGTKTNTDVNKFSTPSKSLYTFSDTSSVTRVESQFTKIITEGTIHIRPAIIPRTPTMPTMPTMPQSSQPLPPHSKSEPVDYGTKASFIPTDSPFYSLWIIVYKLMMDMIPILIFWVLLISIRCWLGVNSVDLYPSDIDKYPYAYYETSQENPPGVTGAWYAPLHNPFKYENDECVSIIQKELGEQYNIQEKYLKYIKEARTDKEKELLRIIKPSALEMNKMNVNRMTGYLREKCKTIKKPNPAYLTAYFLTGIVLQNYIYCNKILSYMHTYASMFNEKVVNRIPSPISIVVFAGLLYILFLSITAINRDLIKELKIEMEPGKGMNSILLNQFKTLLISILSCFLLILLPICTMLVITCLVITCVTLGNDLFFPRNLTIMFLSFLTLIFSFSQVIAIIMKFVGGSNLLEMIKDLYIVDFNPLTLLSIVGVTLPILIGFGYGILVVANIFFTFFQLIRLKEVIDMIKNSAGSVVLVALLLLLLNVKEILGDTYVIMTFILIVLIGYYVITKTG